MTQNMMFITHQIFGRVFQICNTVLISRSNLLIPLNLGKFGICIWEMQLRSKMMKLEAVVFAHTLSLQVYRWGCLLGDHFLACYFRLVPFTQSKD